MTIEYGGPFAPDPFGSVNSATGCPDVGVQKFFGCTVVDFQASASWDGQSSQCTINLVEDPHSTPADRIEVDSKLPVISSPHFFEVTSNTGEVLWEFNGILESLHRNADAQGGKTYTAVLENPTAILEAVTLILDKYAGHGNGLEAVPPNTAANLPFGHVNSSVTWSNVYNFVNCYGAYENNEYGILSIDDPTTLPVDIIRGGFGLSGRNDDGMRAVSIIRAIDVLVNRNTLGFYGVSPYGSPTETFLGGNILYGTDDYDPTSGSTYHYGIDIVQFATDIATLIPDFDDFRIQDESLSLLDFIDRLCEVANCDYFVKLEKFADVPGVNFQTSYSGTNAGGMITITLKPKNALPTSLSTPLGLLSSSLIAAEIADMGDVGKIHPGTQPSTPDEPLDYDWFPPSGYYPYSSDPDGGSFPVEDGPIPLSNDLFAKNSSMGVASTKATSGRMVTGAHRSRMCDSPRDFLYHYWGDIRPISRYGDLSSADDAVTADRGIPIVTPLLPPDDIEDFIIIDIQNAVADTTISHFCHKGMYAASMLEIRSAMTSFESWMAYLLLFKPFKMTVLADYIGNGIRDTLDKLYNSDGTLTYLGKSIQTHLTVNAIHWSNTSKRNASAQNPATLGQLVNSDYGLLLTKIHEQIKRIGDEHYGRSWFVTMPAFTTRWDENAEAVIGNFVRSWEISTSAYIDPPDFPSFEAPQSSFFSENGRMKSYVNFEANTTTPNFSALGIPINGFINFRGFDYSEYEGSEFAYSQIGSDFLYHFHPESVEDKYKFLSSAYFTQYNRGLFRPYASGKMLGQLTLTIGNIVDSLFLLAAQHLGVTTGIASIDEQLDESGIGMLPFAYVKTRKVLFHYADEASRLTANKTFRGLEHLLAKHSYLSSAAAFSKAFYGSNTTNEIRGFSPSPPAVPPRLICVPQQSNRFVYGPWVSDFISGYAGKVEYVSQPDLAPENFIIPTAFGATSGLAGLNVVGQIEANSTDNFSFFAEEDGQFTSPGFPLVKSFDEALVSNGPWMTDISVNLSAESVETSYNFRTHSPRYNKINRRIIDQFRRLAKKRII